MRRILEKKDVIWVVSSGLDDSHLIDAKIFNTRREAFAYAEDLPETPYGTQSPYRIERFEYTGSEFSTDADVRTVRSRSMRGDRY
jgi:hypothetical protein